MNSYFCICAPTWDKLNIRECFLISLYAWRGPQEVDPTDLELPKLPKSTSSAIKNIFGQVCICIFVFLFFWTVLQPPKLKKKTVTWSGRILLRSKVDHLIGINSSIGSACCQNWDQPQPQPDRFEYSFTSTSKYHLNNLMVTWTWNTYLYRTIWI